MFVEFAVIVNCILIACSITTKSSLEELGIYNAQTDIGRNVTEILNIIFPRDERTRYDKRVRPNYAGPPVEIGVSMYIISISSVSEVQMDFTSDFYFRQSWNDPRLAFEPRPGIDALFVSANVAQRIWNPDTFFGNEKSAQFHLATTPNTFIRIGYKGDVLRSTRYTVTSSCAMNLQYFPMDRQLCTIEVESYGYSMADILYKWGKGKDSVGIAEIVRLPQFRVQGLRQWSTVSVLDTGNYSRLVCELEFVRSMGYYLIQIYIPASLIVIISWVSFWLHRVNSENASPARVQLGILTVLTMTTLMSSTNAALPKISYVKSIDVFLGTCFVMVFASLIEYAAVGYMGKRIAMRRRQKAQQRLSITKSNRTKPRVEMEAQHDVTQRSRQSSENEYEIRYRMFSTSVDSNSEVNSDQRPNPRPIDFSKRKLSLALVEHSPDSETIPEIPTPGSLFPSHPFIDRKNPNTLFGVAPADIDKYSRVVFPACFLCFNLLYWIIYMHISEFFVDVERSSTDTEIL